MKRCRPTDLARIEEAISPRDVGKIVLVRFEVEIDEPGPPRVWWSVKSLCGALHYDGQQQGSTGAQRGLAAEVCIPDNCLTPIRPGATSIPLVSQVDIEL